MKSAIRNITAVFKREFFAYFTSPVAYVIVVIFLLTALGFAFFFGNILELNNASLTQPFFFWHPWIYVVLVPAVGMKLWSEEHRLGTAELLLTMPMEPWHAIIGKYKAACVVWLIALALTFPIVVTVAYLGDPDPGPIWSGYIASYLFACSCLAVTLAVSAFTRSQVVCFIVSVAICLCLTLLGFPGITDALMKALPSAYEGWVRFVSYFSFMNHFYEMTKGIVVLRDLVYSFSVITLSLVVTSLGLQLRRA